MSLSKHKNHFTLIFYNQYKSKDESVDELYIVRVLFW
jgi:hypothetical protein